MGKDKKDKVILALIVTIALLLGVLSYLFLIRPAVSGYAVEMQTEGVQYAILSIAQQASTCQTVKLPVGNQTMELVWTKCLEQQKTTN
jgi:hypothetical protein